MRVILPSGVRKVLRAVRSRYLNVRSKPPIPVPEAKRQPCADEAVNLIGDIVLRGRAHGTLEAMRQIDTATRSLSKRKPKGWALHLAYFPDTARGAGSARARRQLERKLKGREPDIADENLPAFVAAIEQGEPDLAVAWWIVTYIRLFRHAHIEAAWSAQKAAARRVLASADTLPTREEDVQSVLAAATLLSGHELLDRHFLEKFDGRHNRLPARMRFDALLSMGCFREARSLAESEFSREDRALASRLKGKHIALVGPARNDLANGANIDASDFVVRTEFIDTEAFRSNASMLGTRTDLSYYNGVMMHHREAEIIDTLERHPEIVAAFRSRWAYDTVKNKSSRTTLHYYQIFSQVFFGRGFAMRHAIRDLLRFAPGKITVYGADFFLSPETHYANYAERKKDQIRSYLTHNVLDTWHFLKMLKTRDVIEADEILSRILALSESDFAAAIENRLRLHGGRRSGPTEPFPQ